MRALDLEVAARAAVAAVVPLAILVGLGHVELAPYAAFGGMTAIFGRGEAYRGRVRTVSVAAVALVASVALGVAVAVASSVDAFGPGAAVPLTAAALVLVLVVGVLTVNVARLGPPTPLFFVFAVLVCASVPTPGDEAWLRIGIAAAAAAFAWAVSLSGWLLRRAVARPGASVSPFKPLRSAAPVRWGALRDAAVWRAIAQHVIGGLATGAIALAFGIGHPYWAVVSVAAVIPPAGAAHSVSRAWHRVFGTVAGVVVTWSILLPDPAVWVLVLVVAVAQFGAEVFVGRHYGVALMFITPLALVVAHLGQPVPVGTLLVDRVVETALGCAVAILAVLAARGLTRRAPSSSS
ncbi:FUSC family protein [Agromyces aerolatus]|uniref:FUSC family protein n=1 Tax=Agromyces sp. LY-1074 TaxID=3074080 RepID=UPI002855A06C|nr:MULTISPECIES: FUSC family protein [unclassified Agromyces]MDR5698315.1 FUSC family protein [Agromyces sp. LY-1074]MDR5704609.1 FUSC family protein [Agromyces sp. LY-1358]